MDFVYENLLGRPLYLITYIHRSGKHILPVGAGLHRALSSMVDCRSRGCDFKSQLTHITAEELYHEIIFLAFLPLFHRSRKGSYQLWAKECALGTGSMLRKSKAC